MLDSLVRVTRRVLRVPETESSQTETHTVRDNGSDISTRRIGGRLAAGPQRRRALASSRTRRARVRFQSLYRPAAGRRPSWSPSPEGPGGSQTALRPAPSGSRCLTKREVHAVHGRCRRRPCRLPRQATSKRRTTLRGITMNLSVRSFEFRRFTPERFHVLLNSLFKVLFNFPSRYLFAIGLAVIFSLRWSLPPT